MTQIKICGIRRFEDIEYLNKLKPEYAGFIFANSIRRIDVRAASSLLENLNNDIKKVGVFVNEEIDKVHNIASLLKLDVLQFHGDETQEYINNFRNYIVWKAIRIKDKSDLVKAMKYHVDGILFDSKIESAYGGTGKKFNWDLLKDSNVNCTTILAGGINADNVLVAIDKVKPDIIDVSSGVEKNGFKDFNLMKDIIEKVRGVF
ncbi:phosphoribosylanthranilate isomerase [Thermoanaerobacterium sp. RBIITD]|uniref:phosphoribosylanthranilate isomerase n=1 Tax=Thermoanaerobacterium sp. RBIITD TaxID=1550240 RepID=UPI000BB7681B|nr:phosphoribosylanthranilate isomerase [Thermoanaerobacterium sp. RBIITD]SNX55284.1 phosphoribosylanthranilate isomerase [Thermoanaerobacterium sp. RBIITD]